MFPQGLLQLSSLDPTVANGPLHCKIEFLRDQIEYLKSVDATPISVQNQRRRLKVCLTTIVSISEYMRNISVASKAKPGVQEPSGRLLEMRTIGLST